MRSPDNRTLGMIIAGAFLALAFVLGWAATQLDGLEWLKLGVISVLFTLLIYGRGWLRRVVGMASTPSHSKSQPRFLKLSHTPQTNGRPPHPPRNSKLETRNRS